MGNKYPLITSAFLNITNRCNLRCLYCFVEQHPLDMTYEVAKDAVDYLIRNGHEQGRTPQVTFFGGEPTLLWDQIIVPIVKYVRHDLNEPFSFNITSNCVLMTDERLSWMRDENIGLLFSIDGGKETQDYNRCFHNGNGSFDALKTIIPVIPKYFPNVMFRSTLIPETCHHMFENILFAQNSGYQNVYVIPNVFQEWSNEKKEILVEQLQKYGDYYIEAHRTGSHFIRLSPFEKAFGKVWRIRTAKGFRTTINCVAEGKCGFCTNGSGSIDTYGNIYACQELPSSKGVEDPFCIGNIYDGIDDVKRELLVQSYDINSVKGIGCKECILNDICDGGCVANNYLISGSLNCVPEMYCYWNQQLIREAIRVANVLGDEENISFRDEFVRLVKDGGYGL